MSSKLGSDRLPVTMMRKCLKDNGTKVYGSKMSVKVKLHKIFSRICECHSRLSLDKIFYRICDEDRLIWG